MSNIKTYDQFVNEIKSDFTLSDGDEIGVMKGKNYTWHEVSKKYTSGKTVTTHDGEFKITNIQQVKLGDSDEAIEVQVTNRGTQLEIMPDNNLIK